MDSTSAPNDWNYETAISSVEEMINKIESGNLPLETVFEEFELAVEQVNQCEQFLNQGMEKMELLIETLEDFEEEF
ncbi:putative exodeoxyribonuclease VII small subunit [Crocosphaera subtropica ATCC 51142]|uniref:Exodeoxyribonuclease 7 small subunit n=1 Tax=Crocosphaera subtropica (strain ATCC 51142 / BH68) TaxID=43989 RepID=B1X2L9_CROS5|nr:exodeoxyribonuclease VII small subunit [Crocosphaera subtropica]ACB54380.1 putative exodeoxyribonuclease VII small subunit [Crocosphaera subtropica ATCC 51142]